MKREMTDRIQKIKNAPYCLRSFVTKQNIFIFLGILLIFFIALRPPTDPDMGWHLRDGTYLIENNFKVAHQDIFSYTMPNFPLIMHEWVTDILMEKTYEATNLFTLSVIFAAIVALAFLLASLGLDSKIEYRISAAVLGTIASIPVLGVRPQMISLLGLALVIYIVFKFRKNNSSKIVYWLPSIFFVWVNVHGGFAIGLFFIATYLAIEITKNIIPWGLAKIRGGALSSPPFFFSQVFFEDCRLIGTRIRNSVFLKRIGGRMKRSALPPRKISNLGVVLFFSALATLVNPYGWRVYIEVVTTTFDQYAKANINEWARVTIYNPMSYQFAIYLSLLGILLLLNFRKNDYTYLALCLVFLYLGLSSWRHMPIFLIVSTPLWVSIAEGLAGDEFVRFVRKKWFLAAMALAIFLIANQRLTRDVPFGYSVEKIAREGAYPLGAVEYLKQNPIDGNMFNEYNWGGFLIWQYPEKKVFVDGRMPSWKFGGQKIFEQHNQIMMFQGDWQGDLKKFDVKFALLYNNPANKIMFLNAGWKEVYGDDISLVYTFPEQ
jgi:hypothetical protein